MMNTKQKMSIIIKLVYCAFVIGYVYYTDGVRGFIFFSQLLLLVFIIFIGIFIGKKMVKNIKRQTFSTWDLYCGICDRTIAYGLTTTDSDELQKIKSKHINEVHK